MTKVRKRALSLILAFCMTFTMMPQIPGLAARTAKAALQGIAQVIIPEKTLNITSGGTGDITGSATFSNATASNAWASASDADREAACEATWSNAEAIKEVSFEIDRNGEFTATVTAQTVTEETTTDVTIIIGGTESDPVAVTISPEDILVSSIVVSAKDNIKVLESGKTLQLTATVKPDNATSKTVEWTSSNVNVATVDVNSGLVTAKSVSADTKVTLTAKATDGSNVAGTYEITVKKAAEEEANPVTGIILENIPGYMLCGETWKLGYKIEPADADAYEILWTSSDETVATVDQTGKITANATKSGTAKITATVKGTDIKAACTVRVRVPSPRLYFNQKESYLLTGKELTLMVGARDWPEENWTAKFEIDKTDVVEQVETDDRSITLRAKNPGTAIIKATVGEVTVTSKVIVTSDPSHPGVVLDDAIKNLENALMGGTPEEAAAAVKEAVSTVRDIIKENVSNTKDFSKFEDYILNAITNMEELMLVSGDYSVDNEFDEDLLNEFGVGYVDCNGAILNAADKNAKSAVLKTEKSTVPSDFTGDKTGAVSIDIKLLLDGNSNTGKLNIPVIITMEVPEALKEVTDILIYHYTSNGVETIKPVIRDGELIFAVTSFSNFVFAKAPKKTNTPTGGSSSGGSVSDGSLSGQWIQDGNGWWFKKTSGGYPANQWAKINGKQYHFNAEGYMMTGWYFENNTWYYLNSQGDMAAKTWVQDNGKWYYVHENGVMLSNQWFQSNGQWYYLTTDGSMAVSTTTPDGYQVNEKGIWIQ